MKVLYLTCRRDWGMFRYSLSTIPQDWEVMVMVEEKDKDLPFPKDVKVVVNNFERQQQNLNGGQAVKAIVDAFCFLTANGDHCVKVDSDTLLIDPDVYSNKEFDVIGIQNTRKCGAVMGQAYTLSTRAAQEAHRFCFTRWNQPDGKIAEDFTISRWASSWLGAKLAILPQDLLYWEYYGLKPCRFSFPQAFHTVANYGWRRATFPDRTPAVKKMEEHFAKLPRLHRRETPPILT